ncbi:MAG: M23 family metallopeptidase, partial [Miltoncostaeaceae bacterium]
AFASVPGGALASSGGPTVHPLNGAGELIGTPHAGTHTLGNWQSDNALDWRIPEGTPLYAVADGVIGPKIGPLSSTESRFAGERLTLETAGNAFYYAHLNDIVVGAGQPVVKGQLLGYSGSANGVPHLHFGQREGDPREQFVSG